MRSHCQVFAKQSGIQTQCKIEDLVTSLGQDLATALFRVTQEALQNVAKHSRAERASVRVSSDGEEVCLSIRDTGIGFDVREAREKPGLGLISIDERMRSLGGRVIVEARPGEGTQLTAILPLASKNAAGPAGSRAVASDSGSHAAF